MTAAASRVAHQTAVPGTEPRRGLLLRLPILALHCGLCGVAAAIFASAAMAQADPGVTVSVMDAQATEGGRLEFPLLLSEEREDAVTVLWELRSDTALEGVDYRAGTGRTRIPAGTTEASIRITTLSDRIAEPEDRFTVELVDVEPIPPDGAVVSETDWRATGTITDDDGGFDIPDSFLRNELNFRLGAGYTSAELAQLPRLALNHVKDLTGIPFASGLESLDLFNSPVEDLAPLRHLSALEDLGIRSGYTPHPDHGDYNDYRVTSPPPEADLNDFTHLPLRAFGISGYQVRDLTPVKKMRRLTGLGVSFGRVSDITPLAGLHRLRSLGLSYNYIGDLEPLAGLVGLRSLSLAGNLITDIAPLANMWDLQFVRLRNNRISGIEALAGMEVVRQIELERNAVSDIEPLAGIDTFLPRARLYLASNPLDETSRGLHIPGLRDRGVAIYHAEILAEDTSALEGEPLEFVLRLTAPVADDVGLHWEVAQHQWAEEHIDFPGEQEGSVIVPAGATEAAFTVQTSRDNEIEGVEPLLIRITPGAGVGFPDGVAMGHRFVNVIFALGLIIDPEAPAQAIPYVGAGSDTMRQTMVRIVNHHRETPTAARVEAYNDSGGVESPVTVAVAPGAARQFVSRDLEEGNPAKGVYGGAGSPGGAWRLEVRSSDFEALAYSRSADGLLTSVHDVVPLTSVGYFVPIFNPARNPNQVSRLRLGNAGERTARVRITGVDDAGRSPGSEISFNLPAGRTRTLTSPELESGAGLNGALGRGTGKWRLFVASSVRIHVANLLESPTGHLSNLSTLAEPADYGDDAGAKYLVPLFPSAMDSKGREGFVRVINRGDQAAEVRIVARDDSRWSYEPVMFTVPAAGAVQFNSHDLESGSADKGLATGLGAGVGDWRLELSSRQDISVGAYVRTADGFLASMHDVVRETDGGHFVPTFNPARNNRQVSLLRLVNRGSRSASVRVQAVDDRGGSPGDEVLLHVGADSARTLSARVLEAGLSGLRGGIGRGYGKWRLIVSPSRAVEVMSLMETPTGHLVNLSTRPAEQR